MRQNKKDECDFFGDFQTLWQCRRLLVLIWMLVMWMEWLNLISHINCIFLMGHKMLEIRSDTPFFIEKRGNIRSKNIPMSPNRLDNSIVYLRCAKKVIFWIFQIVWQTFICKNPSKKLSCLILLAWTFLFREFLNYICSTLVTLFL